MSDTTDNESKSNNDGDSEGFKPHPSSGMFINRRLRSFGAPDLEVVVGKSQHLYRYHSFVLASYSGYVDTMLSSDIWKETKEKHISFPDIEPEVWERVIKVLEPAGIHTLRVKDLLDLLPIFDKYQFEDGMRMSNDILENIYVNIQQSFDMHVDRETFVPLSVMVYNLDLPCKPKAIEYASDLLSQWLTFLTEDQIRQLLPLVENNEDVLRDAVTTVVGRHVNDLSVEEIRVIAKKEDFPQRCIKRAKQVEELDDLLKHLTISESTIYVNCRDDGERLLTGDYVQYDKLQNGDYYERHKKPKPAGALKHAFRPSASTGGWGTRRADARIEAMDVFGNVWHFYEIVKNEESEESGCSRRLLSTWEGGYSSLFPPKTGWKNIDGSEVEIFKITYSFQR